MKIVARIAHPENEKEKLLRLEAAVDDLKNPGTAYLTLNGVEYLIEIHFDD